MTAPSEPPSADGVAAGIADADMVSASAKAQPANPIIRSRFILVPPPLWQVLLRIISSVFAMPAERCIHRLFRTVATDSRNSAASSIALISALTVSAMMPVPRWICRRSLPTSAPGRCRRKSPSWRTCRFLKRLLVRLTHFDLGDHVNWAELLGGLPTSGTKASLAKARREPISARFLPRWYFRLFRQHRSN
jgi:hypothetical protein